MTASYTAVAEAPESDGALNRRAAVLLESQHRAYMAVASAGGWKEMAHEWASQCLVLSGARGAAVDIAGEQDGFGDFLQRGAALTVHAGHVPSGDLGERPTTSIELTTDLGPLGWMRLFAAQGEALQAGGLQRARMLCEQVAGLVAQARRLEQLRRAKRDWEQIFDAMQDGVCICKPDGHILRANKALAEMLGSTIDHLITRKRESLQEKLPEYQELRAWHRFAGSRASAEVLCREFRYGSPERVIVEMKFPLNSSRASLMKPKTTEAAYQIYIMRDITDQRRLQDQLLQSEKLAALGELLSGVAHELNNPLATVVGYAQLLESEAELLPGARRQMHTIHQEAARAAHIVQNLLAFARRSEPEKTRLNINEVLRTVVEMRAYQLQARDVRLVTDYGNELPDVWGDPLQLQQVFLNVINNAAQAMGESRGGGEIRIATEPTMQKGVAGVRLTFADTGPGIAPEHLRRIFDPFFTTKAVGEGTGLGMSVSLRIVSNHEGRIWAESRKGHGATITIELPGTERVPSIEGQTVRTESPTAPHRHVLVVDDEQPVVTLITEILALDDHDVTPAYNGAEALEILKTGDFDLIISDVRMPAVGGPTFFEVLQTTRPDLLPRVIFVTGDTVSQSTRGFLEGAGRPTLAKPFDPQRLRALVNQTLNEQLDSHIIRDETR